MKELTYENPESWTPWHFENEFVEPLTPQTAQTFNPLHFTYVFALEGVPGNYIKLPRPTGAFCTILAATPNRDRAFSGDVCRDALPSALLAVPCPV